MARYIDAEKLWNDRPPFPKDQSDDYVLGFNECMWAFSKLIREQINNAPADVAPRAEVEATLKCYKDTIKHEVAREIFMDIERLTEKYSMGDIEYPDYLFWLGKFKKKYTESEDEE